MFQAMVSVTAVKIQFSSPNGVLLSLSRPGILQKKHINESDYYQWNLNTLRQCYL